MISWRYPIYHVVMNPLKNNRPRRKKKSRSKVSSRPPGLTKEMYVCVSKATKKTVRLFYVRLNKRNVLAICESKRMIPDASLRRFNTRCFFQYYPTTDERSDPKRLIQPMSYHHFPLLPLFRPRFPHDDSCVRMFVVMNIHRKPPDPEFLQARDHLELMGGKS